MTVSPVDVLETAVVAGAFLVAQWWRHEHLAAERQHTATENRAIRKNALDIAKAKAPAAVPAAAKGGELL